ncbi:MAG: hypothetical protein NTX64_09290 [Elusimicrobia bacterium]|nr:hypothetical protein [Elusimicrobiota bacterium]
MGLIASVLALIAASLPSGAAAKSYVPDSALVRLWEDVREKEPMPAPYLTVYRDGKKELKFIASRHGGDAGTFSLIRDAFAGPPDVLIIEGQSSEDGYSPKKVIELMDREAGGFTAKDLEGFETLRSLVGGPGEIRSSEPTFNNEKESFKDKYAIARESELFADEAEFRAWLGKNYGEDGKGDLTRHQGKRFVGAEGGFGHRLDDLVSTTRDAHIAKVIADMLNAHDKVLIVYGAGHRMELAAVLEKMLGKPASVGPAAQEARAAVLPVTEAQIAGGSFHGRDGKVLQSEAGGRDFFIQKREGFFCVKEYGYARVFQDDAFIAESCFKTVDGVNDHLRPFFKRAP